jgi:methionyl-tRNA formyltransferase
LLPRWRGAAPVHRAILAGDTETGVTIMKVILALDAGPMLDRVVTAIDPNETSQQLEHRLAELGADLLVSVVDRIAAGATPPEVAQDDRQATYAARLDRNDSPIDWARPAHRVHNQIRGLHPWPLASTTFNGRRLLLHQSMVHDAAEVSADPGTVLTATRDELVVATQPGSVRLLEIQPEGKRVMAARDFMNGTRLVLGDRFS